MKHTNHIMMQTTTAKFVEFKKQLIASPGYSSKKVIKQGVLENFKMKIVSFGIANARGKFPLDGIVQSFDFWCDDYTANLFQTICK